MYVDGWVQVSLGKQWKIVQQLSYISTDILRQYAL